MIQREDIDAMAIYNDSTGYWDESLDDFYSTPMEMVKYFAEVTGQVGSPNLYLHLIQEEWNEWLEALEGSSFYGAQEELKELADLVYVIYGYANAKGWNLDEALYRVHENNLGRIQQPDGTIQRREDGKILKNPDHPKVDLEDLV